MLKKVAKEIVVVARIIRIILRIIIISYYKSLWFCGWTMRNKVPRKISETINFIFYIFFQVYWALKNALVHILLFSDCRLNRDSNINLYWWHLVGKHILSKIKKSSEIVMDGYKLDSNIRQLQWQLLSMIVFILCYTASYWFLTFQHCFRILILESKWLLKNINAK